MKFISSFLVNVTCIINFLVLSFLFVLTFILNEKGLNGIENHIMHKGELAPEIIGYTMTLLATDIKMRKNEKGSQNTEKIAHVCSII